MKHLFTMTELPSWNNEEHAVLDEGTPVLLQGQPFDDRVRVFVAVGYLNKSEYLATQIGQYVHGRRWGTISRNDGHYIEVTTEDHDDTGAKINADKS